METDEKTLIQIINTQHAILTLLNHTLLSTTNYQRSLDLEEQNKELIYLADQARRVIARKPKLKQAYEQLAKDKRFDVKGYLL